MEKRQNRPASIARGMFTFSRSLAVPSGGMSLVGPPTRVLPVFGRRDGGGLDQAQGQTGRHHRGAVSSACR